MLMLRLVWLGCLWLPGCFLYALDLELTQGINASLPVAISDFGTDAVSHSVSNTIAHDLSFSGQFNLVTRDNTLQRLAPAEWRQKGADSLVTGRIRNIGLDRYEVSMQLIDLIASNRVLLTNTIAFNAKDARALAHHLSDLIYQKLTGEKGIFSTRIAYVRVKRQGEHARYTLEVADYDGANPQSLLVSSEPIMSPAWSPNAHQIAYVSFEKKRSQIFTVTVETGKRQLITDFTGINGAPSWSSDGRQLAVVLSKGGHSKIYSVDMLTGRLTQLTFGEAIDTEPKFSTDGRTLLFTSGRGGTPQIYRMSLTSNQITRITFQGNYNGSASYTPDQKYIVMMHRNEDNAFTIGMQSVANDQITSLTHGLTAESPSVSPNSRFIVYATHRQDQGVLAVVSLDGRSQVTLPARDGDCQGPAWSPYLGG